MVKPNDRRRPRARGGRTRPAPAAHSRSAVVRHPRPAIRGLGLALIFGLAAAWRLAYLVRLARTPFAGSLDADSRIYWSWSDVILRHGLVPPAPFFLAPLYPYVLAGWRALGAGGIPQVLAIQSLLGAAAVVLLTHA